MARRQRIGAACTFLGVLFLVLSQTQMVARAQQTAVSGASGANNSTASGANAEAIAKVLTNVFGSLGNDLNTLGGNSTGIVDALRSAMTQQQSLAGLGALEGAAEGLASLLASPASLGTGDNIKAFLKQAEQYKALADMLNGQLDGARLREIRIYLDKAIQLALAAVAAGPLAQLAFATAQVALAAAILGLLGGIFFIVGSSLFLSANVAGLGAASAASPKKDGKLADSKWFQDIKTKATALEDPILSLAFSDSPLSMLQFSDGILGTAQSAFQLLPAPAA